MNFNRQLIELVKGCRLIYDAGDANYGDAMQKERAWKEIARKLDVQGKPLLLFMLYLIYLDLIMC